MSALLILRALLFAGECFLASLLLPLLAFAVTACLRRRAALRHLVWTTLFGVLAVLPVVALALPPRLIVEHLAAPVIAAPPMVAAVVLAPVPPPSLFTLENGVMALVALWLAGLAWQLLRMAVGGLGLLRLRRASVAFPAGIEPGCDVRLSHDECGPSTFGILRPVVLLPRSAESWSVARLDAVLRHEAAHVARRDAASQFVARLVCAVYWLNPLLWLAFRAQRRAAEIAADDVVLASGMTPSLYAEELVRLAAEANGIVPGLAMARPPLTQRVQAVLAENSSRKGVTRMDIAKTVSFGLAATLLLGVARFDIAVAQPTIDVVPAAPSATTVSVVPGAPNAPNVTIVPAAPGAASVEIVAKAAAAQAERVKARADRMAAEAKARAAAETDPAKRAQAMEDAAKVAAQSARVKAQADQAAAQYTEEARKHMALAFQLADEVRQKALLDRQRAEVDRQRLKLAEVMPPSDGHAESSASRSDGITINGTTFSGNVELKQGKPGGSITITADRMQGALPPPNGVMTRFISSTRNGVHIDAQVDSADPAVLNRPEVIAAVTAAVRTAMVEADKKISAAIADARAKAGLPPIPAEDATRAERAVPFMTITPVPSLTITPIAPVAPMLPAPPSR